MEINELYKLILAVTIGGSIVTVSIYIAKLLAAVTDNIKDLRKTVQNVGVITDGLIENQKSLTAAVETISRIVKKAEGAVDSITNKIIKPLNTIFAMLGSVIALLKSLGLKGAKKKD
ncbi:MAG: hypothetical protein PHS44_00675 [Candidatus Dojkabacteria bacterium]|jgi:ABC-type transporter Mla subunit MlaD|nr:hypothetical protein [Candidatus Dojkabacteria bacterium]